MKRQAVHDKCFEKKSLSFDIICESGEFDSPNKLQVFLRLLCELPGNYEILVSSQKGEEALIHCGNNILRNAMWREVVGIDALSTIFSWSKVRFRIEPLPVVAPRTIDQSLESALSMVARRNLRYNQHSYT